MAATTSPVVMLREASLAGVEPDAHGVVAGAEQDDRAHAGNPEQLVAHVQLAIVAQVEGVAAVVGADQVHDHGQVRTRLLGRDADLPNDLRQARQGPVDAVLHRRFGHFGIGADLERDRQRHGAVGGRLRVEVQEVFDAVDLLLERRRNSLRDHPRIGAGELRPHDHLRRRDFGVLGNRQPEDRQQPQQKDDDREDSREAGPGR
jgi:hypothetical protein